MWDITLLYYVLCVSPILEYQLLDTLNSNPIETHLFHWHFTFPILFFISREFYENKEQKIYKTNQISIDTT